MRRKIQIAGLIVIAVTLVACGSSEEPDTSTAPTKTVQVETAVAAFSEVPDSFRATGSVEPLARVSPGTKIMGRVESVPVREGDRVRKGQLLAGLEKRDLQAAVEQADAAVAMAQANLDNTRAMYDRMVDLHGRGSVTEKNLEDATAGYRVAEAGLKHAEANLAAAKVTLSYAEVRSHISGYVVSRMVEAGDIASPGRPLFTIEDLSRVKVTVKVPESDVTGLTKGDPATVEVEVLELSTEAKVHRVIPAADPMSRTYQVQLLLDNPDGKLKSGMFARALFSRGARQTMVVPATALVKRGQLEGLFVVGDDGVARIRWIRSGRTVEGGQEIISGLSEGETYVLSPPPGLADGTPVEAR
jgi:RND family efflux transporter MFP subunit